MVVEVTMNMAEYGSKRLEPQNVNFESIIRGLKNDIFEKSFSYMYDSIAKEKKWGKNVWKFVPLRGWWMTHNGKCHLKFITCTVKMVSILLPGGKYLGL